MKKINVGVLALQGDFKEHIKINKCRGTGPAGGF